MDFLGAAIGATAQHISDGISLINQRETNKANLEAIRLTNEANRQLQAEANAANLQLAKYQNAENYNLWKEQIREQRSNEAWLRDYNSPAQQMQRYKEAGLNPNLIYGQSNTASAAPTPSAPKMERAIMEASRDIPGRIEPLDFGSPGSTVMQAFQLMKDLQVKDAQIDNIKSQTNANDAKARNFDANTILAGAKKLGVEQSTRFAEMMMPYQVSALQANTDLARRRIDGIQADIDNKIFMQGLAKQRIDIAWKNADTNQRRVMLQSCALALKDRLVQLQEHKWEAQLTPNYAPPGSSFDVGVKKMKKQYELMQQMVRQREVKLGYEGARVMLQGVKLLMGLY